MSLLRIALHLILLAMVALPVSAHGVLEFKNGLWWNGRAFEQKTMYSVDNVFREAWQGEVTTVVDLGGRYLVPPFADAHNHVFADGADIERQLAQYLRAGIFYVANPNSTARLSAPIRARMNQPETVDVSYSFGGVTASGGHPVQIYDSIASRGAFAAWRPSDMAGQAYFIVDSKADLAKKWPRILEAKPDFIKAYLDHSEEFDRRRSDPKFYGLRGLDPEVLRSIVSRAHASGLRVAAHVTTAGDFANAVKAGVDEIAHLPLARITPADAEVAARRKITVVTTTLSHRPISGIADLDKLFAENLELLRAAGVRVALGTDNGASTVLDEASNVRRLTKWSNTDLLNLLTVETALEIFPTRKIGSLRAGFEASFLALDGDPIADWTALRRVAIRFKQGHRIDVAPEKPSVVSVLLPLALKSGGVAAVDEYGRLLREEGKTFAFGEAELNRLGYELLRHEQIADAIVAFEHNAKLFPASANVWDSLAESYLKNGEKERAIANYLKSLQLNPHNKNAEEMLRKLASPPLP